MRRARRARGAFPLRACVLLLIPPLVLVLQLLALWTRLPRAPRAKSGEHEGPVVYSVISINPVRRFRHRLEEEEQQEEVVRRKEGARAYEDENEIPSKVIPRGLEVQPWVVEKPSFTAELNRIVTYITTPQVNCSRVLSPGHVRSSRPPAVSPRWLLCAEEWLLPAADAQCVAYSFSMDGRDADFLKTVSGLGCEVHRLDPSNSNASGGNPGNSLASNHGDRGAVSQHRMWLHWRASRKHNTRARLGSVSQTLSDVMAALEHHTVDFLYADLLSAEWRVFQNWIEAETLQNIHHLVVTVHFQWAGFEVGGTSEEVLRYWFSLLKGFQASGLRLVHSSAGEGHRVLKQTVTDAHSSYTLSWVNMRH
ncbi:methyltransferase-like protein 24 [Thalassophryne amazonica]|uniref:methyltransferase-like protein 24 n=1 Tax=Thalassophryne amazonica TaxID=390379 RepID=UPI0014723168|nr:methyltransferase-like protein 24 [Thalassophryne amazonica]